MFARRMISWLAMAVLAAGIAGCGGGGSQTAEAPPDVGGPDVVPPPDDAGGGPTGMLPPADPAMVGGGPPAAGGGGGRGSGGAPCGVDPAKDLAAATTLLAMGREFMKIEAYDLALAAFQDSAKYEPATVAQAKQGAREAAAKLKASFKAPPPPRVVARRPSAFPEGYVGGPEGLPAPGMEGMPPGAETAGGPGPMPDMASANAGYQVDMPVAPPTAIGF